MQKAMAMKRLFGNRALDRLDNEALSRARSEGDALGSQEIVVEASGRNSPPGAPKRFKSGAGLPLER
jgi:hypothetical protein